MYLHSAGGFLCISAGRSRCSGVNEHPAHQHRPPQVSAFLQAADRQQKGKEEKLTQYHDGFLLLFSLPSTL